MAITRGVSASIARCELTHLDREPVCYDTAVEQHAAYETALARAGLVIHRLPSEPDFPDAVFVEDTAIVLDELAVLTRPGAETRRGELASVADALARWRPVKCIESPGTLDGGDVMQIEDRIYVGKSARSNDVAIEQLRDLVTPLGYQLMTAPVIECLHLKSAVTRIGADTVLINPEWTDKTLFADFKCIEIDPTESFAANAVLLADTVLYSDSFPHTRKRMFENDVEVSTVPASELAKAEGGVSCCSIVFKR